MLERRFLFFPVAELVYTPDDVDLEYEDVRIQTSDGLIINGWFLPGSDTSVTWLWFHGNGGNLGHRIRDLEQARHYSDANYLSLITTAMRRARESQRRKILI